MHDRILWAADSLLPCPPRVSRAERSLNNPEPFFPSALRNPRFHELSNTGSAQGLTCYNGNFNLYYWSKLYPGAGLSPCPSLHIWILLPIFLLKLITLLRSRVPPAVVESLIAEQRTQLITSSRMTHWERMLMSESISITRWTRSTFFPSYRRRWHSPLLLRLTFSRIPHVDLSGDPFPKLRDHSLHWWVIVLTQECTLMQ